MTEPSRETFGDRLIAVAGQLGPLCVGIDPHPGRIALMFGGDTPEGLRRWSLATLEAVRGVTGVVKPQVGLFERHGPEGMVALADTCRAARSAGLLVIADAKRGDIGSTAEGYARAYLADDAPFPADCVTVNPYMGIDTLEPFLWLAEKTGRGVAVLARTSNPGSADFQARSLEGAPLFARVVQALAPAIARLQGRSGWSSLMLVAGATGPEEARALRALAPSAPFLVPGYGAQGAGEAEALAGFVPGAGGVLEGGVVNASRSITFADGTDRATSIEAWQAALRTAALAAQTALRTAATRQVA